MNNSQKVMCQYCHDDTKWFYIHTEILDLANVSKHISPKAFYADRLRWVNKISGAQITLHKNCSEKWKLIHLVIMTCTCYVVVFLTSLKWTFFGTNFLSFHFCFFNVLAYPTDNNVKFINISACLTWLHVMMNFLSFDMGL